MQIIEMAEAEAKFSSTGQVQLEMVPEKRSVGVLLIYKHLYVKKKPMRPLWFHVPVKYINI